jgi:hypothetical protein
MISMLHFRLVNVLKLFLVFIGWCWKPASKNLRSDSNYFEPFYGGIRKTQERVLDVNDITFHNISADLVFRVNVTIQLRASIV